LNHIVHVCANVPLSWSPRGRLFFISTSRPSDFNWSAQGASYIRMSRIGSVYIFVVPKIPHSLSQLTSLSRTSSEPQTPRRLTIATSHIVPVGVLPFFPLSAGDLRMCIPITYSFCFRVFPDISFGPGNWTLSSSPISRSKTIQKEASPATSFFHSHPYHSPPYHLVPLHCPSSFFQIISSFLCNFYQHLLPQKEAASGQCRHGNTRWWGECMIYFLRLGAHNFGTVRCYALNNGWSLHLLLGLFLIFNRTRVVPSPYTPRSGRCDTCT
jgi:hypothetical protein